MCTNIHFPSIISKIFLTCHHIWLKSCACSWVFSLHMWLVYRSNKDTPTLLCSWKECKVTHDAIQNFTSIVKDVRSHVLCKQTHFLPISLLQSSWWQVDIVFTTNGTHTLTDVIIVDPICANLVSQVIFFQRMTIMIVAHAKFVSYYD